MTTATKTKFVIWWCRAGHELTAHEDALEVWCPLAGHKGTNAMRKKSDYPNWGPQ